MQTNYILWEYFINFLEVVLFYILMQSKLTLKRLRTYSNKAIYIFTSSMANLMCPEYD